MGEVVDFPNFGKIHFSFPFSITEAIQQMNVGDSLHISGQNNRDVPLKMKVNRTEEQLDFFVDGDSSVLDVTNDYWSFVMNAVNGALYLMTASDTETEGMQETMVPSEMEPTTPNEEQPQFIEVSQDFGMEPVDRVTISTEDTPLEGNIISSEALEKMSTGNVSVIDPGILDRIQAIHNMSTEEATAVSALITPTLDLDTLANAAAAGMNLSGDGPTQIVLAKDEATGLEQVVITKGSSFVQEYQDDTNNDPDYIPEEPLPIKYETSAKTGKLKKVYKKRPKSDIGAIMREVPIKTCDVTTYRCYECGLDYLDMAILSRHFNRRHQGVLEPDRVTTPVLSNAHICFICNAASANMKGLQGHLERMHKVKYVRRPVRKARIRKSKRRSHLDPGAAIAYCSLCNEKKGFLYSMNLVYHLRKFHSEHPGFAAAHKEALDSHFGRYKHKGTVQVYCEICNDLYYGAAVVTHIDKVHSDLPKEELELVKKRAREAIARGYQERAKLRKKDMAECPKCHDMITVNYLRSKHLQRCTGTPLRTKRTGEIHTKVDQFRKREIWPGPSPCSECGKVFSTKALYNQHLRNTHFISKRTPLKLYVCGKCGRKFASKAKFTRHNATHSDIRPFECDICHKKYKTVDVLNDHKRLVHLRKFRYKCQYCSYSTDRKTKATAHEEKCEKNPMKQEATKKNKATNAEGVVLNPDVLSEFYVVKNYSDGSSDADSNSMKESKPVVFKDVLKSSSEELKEANTDQNVCGTSKEQANRKEGDLVLSQETESVSSMSSTDKTQYLCPECNKVLGTKSGLYNHRRQQHNVVYRDPMKLYVCNICDKEVVSKHKLKMHMLTHTGEKLAQCMECDKKFRDIYTLKDHIQMVHLKVYKYNCDHCKQGFNKLDRLSKHLELCTSDNPALSVRRKGRPPVKASSWSLGSEQQKSPIENDAVDNVKSKTKLLKDTLTSSSDTDLATSDTKPEKLLCLTISKEVIAKPIGEHGTGDIELLPLSTKTSSPKEQEHRKIGSPSFPKASPRELEPGEIGILSFSEASTDLEPGEIDLSSLYESQSSDNRTTLTESASIQLQSGPAEIPQVSNNDRRSSENRGSAKIELRKKQLAAIERRSPRRDNKVLDTPQRVITGTNLKRKHVAVRSSEPPKKVTCKVAEVNVAKEKADNPIKGTPLRKSVRSKRTNVRYVNKEYCN